MAVAEIQQLFQSNGLVIKDKKKKRGKIINEDKGPKNVSFFKGI